MAFHALFLETSYESGAQSFIDYASWAATVLEARDVPRSLLITALEILAQEMPRGRDTLLQAAASIQDSDPPPQSAKPDPITDSLLQGDATFCIEALGTCEDAEAHRHASARLMDCMEDVGNRWARGDISVAQEHLATATCQRVLASLRTAINPERSRGRLILACVEGNLHDMGLRASADLLIGAGWDVDMLGADVPTQNLVDLARSRGPDAVFISTALATQVFPTRQAVKALHAADIGPVVVGGQAYVESGEMWRLTGADGVGMAELERLL